MTDREILELLLSKMNHMEAKMDNMESRLDAIESRMDATETAVKELKLHIEIVTDRNIGLIAENYVSLAKRFNENIKVIDQTLAYQIKISFLADEIDQLKKEVEKLKEKIA